MKIDNRRKYVDHVKYGLYFIAGMLLASILIRYDLWEKKQQDWYDSQVSMLLSPTWGSNEVQAQEIEPTPSPEELVIAEIKEVFGKDGDDAVRVFTCESKLKSKCNDGLNKNGSVDCGIAQVNSVHGVSRKWLLKPEINIRVAKQLFDEQGWNPWRSSNSCHHMLGY
jgi:hypothetical protein